MLILGVKSSHIDRTHISIVNCLKHETELYFVNLHFHKSLITIFECMCVRKCVPLFFVTFNTLIANLTCLVFNQLYFNVVLHLFI